MMKNNFTSHKVSFGEKVGYSFGDGSANLVFQMMMFQMYKNLDIKNINFVKISSKPTSLLFFCISLSMNFFLVLLNEAL